MIYGSKSSFWKGLINAWEFQAIELSAIFAYFSYSVIFLWNQLFFLVLAIFRFISDFRHKFAVLSKKKEYKSYAIATVLVYFLDPYYYNVNLEKQYEILSNVLHSVKTPCISDIFIFCHFDWKCCDGTEGCVYLSVCICVCVCVYVWKRWSPNGWVDFDEIF